VRDVIFSKRLIFSVIWFGCVLLLVGYMGGVFNARFDELGDNNEHGSFPKGLFSTWLFPILGQCGWIFTPITGNIMQKFGYGAMMALTNVLLAMCVGAYMVPHLGFQIVTLILYAALQVCAFSTAIGSLAGLYPLRMLGTMLAVNSAAAAVIGITSFGIVAFDEAVLGGKPWYVLVGLVVVNTPSLYAALLTRRLERKSDEEQLLSP
jgi:hypothetical protein